MQEIEPEEQAGDLLIDETLFEEDKEDLPKEQLRNTSAAYLLQLKKTYNLSQKALDDIIQITSTLVSAAVKSVCVNIANKLLIMKKEMANFIWAKFWEGKPISKPWNRK